jgi:hypothetical protein
VEYDKTVKKLTSQNIQNFFHFRNSVTILISSTTKLVRTAVQLTIFINRDIMHKREAHRFDQLSTKFVQALELQGYAYVTADSYGRGIRRVAKFFDRYPDQRPPPLRFARLCCRAAQNPVLVPPSNM